MWCDDEMMRLHLSKSQTHWRFCEWLLCTWVAVIQGKPTTLHWHFLHGTWTGAGAQRSLWPYNDSFFSRGIKACGAVATVKFPPWPRGAAQTRWRLSFGSERKLEGGQTEASGASHCSLMSASRMLKMKGAPSRTHPFSRSLSLYSLLPALSPPLLVWHKDSHMVQGFLSGDSWLSTSPLMGAHTHTHTHTHTRTHTKNK